VLAVSTPQRSRSERPYHHGHLREALIDAALASARTDGPDAVVLRAATRQTGVSPGAAYRHFSDRDDLLRAVARRCLDHMGGMMERRLREAEPLSGPGGAWTRLHVAGRAYVEFATTEPGWFHTAFAIPVEPEPSRPGGTRGLFQILVDVLDELAATGAITSGARVRAEYVAWSSVHGIATLLAGGSLRDLPPSERDAAIDRVVRSVAF
jgi:AcrR family transcriptional regulator